jgi:penicillin-insensitive murein endopeptidase
VLPSHGPLFAATLLCASVALGQSSHTFVSRSHGSPWDGRLEGGVLLRESARIRYLANTREADHHYGTARLVAALELAAETVATDTQPLVVGDLSAREGADIDGHRSHENGRDADLAFFHRDAQRAPVVPDRFLNMFVNHTKYFGRRIYLDTDRTWRFVEALLTFEGIRICDLFVARGISAHLLDHARSQAASTEVLREAARVLHPPANAVDPHRSHFHLRIACDPSDGPDCEDEVTGR